MTDEIECALTGRIGTEPTLRTSKAGKPWLSFSVAVGSDDATQWAQVGLFGDTAQELAATLAKGTRVYIEGRIKLNTWTAANGKERSGLSVSSFHVVPLGQIGRRKPSKPKADRTVSGDAATRADWQRPPAAAERSFDAQIPF